MDAKVQESPPIDGTTELRRYLTLDALVHMLTTRQLRLTRVDTFRDPFEGSVPKRQIDDQLLVFSSRNEVQMHGVAANYRGTSKPRRRNLDPWTEWTLRRRAITCSAQAAGPPAMSPKQCGAYTAGIMGQKAKASCSEALCRRLRRRSRPTIFL